MRHHRSRLLSVLVAAPLLLPAAAWAEGTISGIVLNGLNGAPVAGVSVQVEGSELATATDPDGLFTLRGAPLGPQTLLVEKDRFESQRVGNVEVTLGEVTDVSAILTPVSGSSSMAVAQGSGEAFSEEITVITEASAISESAVLLERKQAAQISDLIGQEEFAKNPGGDAAGVLMRVTGVSVQEGKYAYVRGLGDRYSNTTLNGSKMPSTEFERKVVPLDLFPSDLLEKVSVSKSYSVDLPGEFAAGTIDLRTQRFPARQTFSVGLSVDQDSESTGEPFLTAAGGLSFSGSGGQPQPATVPDEPLIRFSRITGNGFTQDELEAIGEELIGSWSPAGAFPQLGGADEGDPGYGFDLSYGNTFGRLGLVLSGTYGNDFTSRGEDRIFYSIGSGGLQENEAYTIDYSTEEVKQGFMGNLSYALSNNHRVEVRSVYTDLSDSEGRFQDGFFSDVDAEIEDYRVSYRGQEILNTQLRGEHFLPRLFGGGSLIEWRYADSTADATENRRQTLYLEGPDGRFRLTDNAQSGFMYFNDLEDTIEDAALEWSAFFSRGAASTTVQVGYHTTDNERDFAGRRLRFFHRDTQGIDLTLAPEQLFNEELIRPDGFEVEEITRSTDQYDGLQEVDAGFAQVDVAWDKWRFIGGVRFEDSLIEVVTLDRTRPGAVPTVTLLDESETPYALSVVYALSDRMNLRGVVSQTLNRPTFRELAPFKYTHIVGGYAIEGNPDLVSATIDSYDLRWEFFPAARDVIAASVFLKEFDRPIERVVIPGAEFLETFQNARAAENVGVELELRRNLSAFRESWSPFTVIVNYTWVDSEIEVDPGSTTATNPTRALVGQPDNVINAVFEWDGARTGSLLRVLYNLTGDRVAIAGSFGLPDVIEDARDTLDVTYIQRIGETGLKFKATARNLLSEEKRWSQAGRLFRSYDPGRSIGLSLGWSL